MNWLINPPRPVYEVVNWLVSVLLPIALVLTAVRLAITPAYVFVEYRTPNFPPDPYGFTLDDRMKWAIISLEYLVNDADIDYFEAYRFEDGTRIYNDRELHHMDDVKVIVLFVMRLWGVSIGAILLAGYWAWKVGFWEAYKASLSRGVLLGLGFVFAIVIFMAISWQAFFVFFHQLLFDDGTWTFYYSDTFIRLFPERFWRDTFLWVGGLTAAQAIGIWYFSRKRS